MPRPIDQRDLDEMIFKRQIIVAIKTIVESRSCRIAEAIDILGARYEELRVSKPDRFVCGPDEYWKDFYS